MSTSSIATSILIAACVYLAWQLFSVMPELPDRLASKFALDGTVRSSTSKAVFAWIFGGIAALMVLAFLNAGQDAQGNLLMGDWGVVALISANAYVFFFNLSWGPVMWVMLGEMFPNQIRGSGLAVAGLSQWLTNFAITMTFPIFLASIGLMGAYGLYAACAVISAVFVHKMVHETRGLELEEMKG